MADTGYITEKIRAKKDAYKDYDFIPLENNAIMTFFDLAQEFDAIDDFYSLCVSIPKVFFNLEARLYLSRSNFDDFMLVSKTDSAGGDLNDGLPEGVGPAEHMIDNSLVLPIRGKKSLIEEIPLNTDRDVIGLIEIYPASGLDAHKELFFEKYANRIGFNLHNRFLVEKNIEHLRFIRSLVSDIEHNIIVPNIGYKLFLRRMKGKIKKMKEIEGFFNEAPCGGQEKILAEMSDVNSGLSEQFENIEKHYENMTLFLETLLRRSHFDQGRLTLRTKRCNMKKDVLLPQLERYTEQFRNMGISMDDRSSGMPDEDIISVVDVGLIAQVYANLFSNALKYAREITTESGEKKKYIAYGHEIVRNFFGEGKDGVKYNVFSSGPHISSEERDSIFEEGFRGTNIESRPGTGHGLAFIKNAIEIHGGIVGYEAVNYGNNFYFILPR